MLDELQRKNEQLIDLLTNEGPKFGLMSEAVLDSGWLQNEATLKDVMDIFEQRNLGRENARPFLQFIESVSERYPRGRFDS